MAVYELVGTALFMYLLIVSMADDVAVPLALFILILLFGGVTGGSFNPAVTLGVYVNEREWTKNLWFTFVILTAQFVGAMFGLGLAALSVGSILSNGTWEIPEQFFPVIYHKKVHSVLDDAGLGVETEFGEDLKTMTT